MKNARFKNLGRCFHCIEKSYMGTDKGYIFHIRLDGWEYSLNGSVMNSLDFINDAWRSVYSHAPILEVFSGYEKNLRQRGD